MKTKGINWFGGTLGIVVWPILFSGLSISASAQQPGLAERVAKLKATLAASEVVLRQYEWVQTTTVSVKDDEKSRRQERCFYGADGKITKVLLTQPAPEEKKRGLRGRIVERKKTELEDYMKEAVALVKQYVPPNHKQLQAVRDAGNVLLQPIEPGKRARLIFNNYLKNRDSLAIDIDLVENRPLAANIKTFLDSGKEPVTLAVKFGTVQGATVYASDVTLEAKGKSLKVVVENSGYRKMGP